MKESGGKIYGEFTVKQVRYFEKLTPKQAIDLMLLYKKQLCIDDAFIESKKFSKYATLINISQVKLYKIPYDFPKKDMRSWIILK